MTKIDDLKCHPDNPQKWITDVGMEFRSGGTKITFGQIIEFIVFEAKKEIDEYIKHKIKWESS